MRASDLQQLQCLPPGGHTEIGRWKDNAGKRHEHTEWTRIVCWGKNADLASQYLRKGSYIRVEGALRGTEWDDKTTGSTRYGHEVRAFEFGFLAPAPRTDASANGRPADGESEFEEAPIL